MLPKFPEDIAVGTHDDREYLAVANVATLGGGTLQVVLAYLPGNTTEPYVTWMRNTTSGEPGTFDGHYFRHSSEARADFVARCAHEMHLNFKECATYLPETSLSRK